MDFQSSFSEFDSTLQKQTAQYSGLLGLPIDGSKIVNVPSRSGFVYVRLRDNLSEVVQVYNDKVSPIYDFPVIIQRQGNRWIVVGKDSNRYETFGTSAPFLPAHGSQHSFDRDRGVGGDTVWVYPDQFMPLLVYPSGTYGASMLMVGPYMLQRESDFAYVGNTGTQNLLIYKPTNSTAIVGLVGMDKVTGNPTVLIASGTPMPGTSTGSATVADYAPYPPSNVEPLYLFRLVSGTTAINWSNLYNARQFIGGSTSTGSTSGGTGTSLAFQDEGTPLGTPGIVNFVGAQVSVTVSGSVARVFVTGSAGGGVPSFITGSIPYADNDGVLKESNQNLAYDDTFKTLWLRGGNRNLPLLTNDQIALAILPTGTNTTVTAAMLAFGTGTLGSPSAAWNGYRSRGTLDSPAPVQSGDALMSVIGAGYDGLSWVNATRIRLYANGDWVTGAYTPTRIDFEVTPSGSTTRRTQFQVYGNSVNIPTGSTYNRGGIPIVHGIQAGSNISIDNSNPESPIISASGGGGSSDGWTLLTGTFTRIASALDGTFTVTIASPAVVTKNSHGLVNGQKIRLTTTGALPTGLSTGTDYYVVYLTANTFGLATTLANALQTTATRINTSGTQSGTHSIVVQTDPNYRIQATGVDLTTTLYEGMPFKLTQNSIVRYGWICSQPAYSGGDTTFWVVTRCDDTNADYDILDTGTYSISDFYYGLPKQPGIGMPVSPSSWTVTVTDANNNTQATPGTTNCTPGGIGIQKPIGSFTLKFVATIWLDIAATQCSITMGLTEDKTTFTEPLLTFYQVTYATTVAAALGSAQTPISGDTKVFVLGGLTGTAGATNLRLRGDLGSGGYTRKIVLTATVDYL